MNLERELRGLDVAWPPTPSFRFEPAPARRRRTWLLVGVAAACVALAAALAVPASRSAILRLLHLGGVSVERVETLPPAEERPLGADLGQVVGEREARLVVPRLVLPRSGEAPPLHESGEVVSLVLRYRGRPVLLSELPGDASLLKKLAVGGTSVEFVRVAGGEGAWLSGRRHVVVYPAAPARLAGDTLVWVVGRTTYRLEGPGLRKAAALELARSLG